MAKKLSYPSLLMGCVFILDLFALRRGFPASLLRMGALQIINLLGPLVFLVLLQKNSKKGVGAAALVYGCLEILSFVTQIRMFFTQLFQGSSLFDLIMYGSLKSVLFAAFCSAMLLILGVNLLKEKDMPKSYKPIFWIAAFVALYGSTIMAVANPMAILSELPSFLYVLALWYIPKKFAVGNTDAASISRKKIMVLVLIVAGLYALLAFAGGLSGSDSHRNDIAYDEDGFLGYSDEFWDWYVENN